MRAKEFIVETAEEIRELESLSGMIADKVMPIFSKSQRDYARIIKLKYLNLPQFKSPAVNDIIANASISMYRWWPGDTLGSWHNVEQNVTMRKDMLDNRNKFVSTLAHELTHALDRYKGVPRQYSKMTTKSKATAGDEYENYLRLQYEIDARLTQALLEIGSNIKELQDIDQLFSAPGEPTPKEQQVLSNAISWAFEKHQIAKLFPQGARDPKYRRLLTRAYKFYSTPAVAPQATEPTLVQRAKNWIGLNVLAEDANPARQAAKAIWNKKHHKKPKGVAEGTDPDEKYTIKKSYTMSKAGVEKAVWYIMDGDFVVDVTDLRRDAKYYADKWNAAEKESSNASQNPHKPAVAEDESNDTAISLSKLGKFHPGTDTLAEFVPERATAQYALHPDKWESTFYSLTNKDSDKLKYYGPKKISIPPGTLVGDMAIANKFYRAKTPEEKQQYAEAYKASLQPYPVDVSEYRMPELLIPRQGVAENFADGRNPQHKGDSARHGIPKHATIAQLEKIRSSKTASPRKKQLAHWQINMRRGKAKR